MSGHMLGLQGPQADRGWILPKLSPTGPDLLVCHHLFSTRRFREKWLENSLKKEPSKCSHCSKTVSAAVGIS